MEQANFQSSFETLLVDNEFNESTQVLLQQLHNEICDNLDTPILDTPRTNYEKIRSLLDEMKQYITTESKWFHEYQQALEDLIIEKQKEEWIITDEAWRMLENYQEEIIVSNQADDTESSWTNRFSQTIQQISDFFDEKALLFGVSFESIRSFVPDTIRSPVKETFSQIKEWAVWLYDTLIWFFWWKKEKENKTRTKKEIIKKFAIQSSVDYDPSRTYTANEYFTMIWPLALEIEQKFGIPASIVAAQSALESWYWNSWLTQKWFNFFGFKKSSTRPYETITLIDNWEEKSSPFKKFICPEESFFDYAQSLKNLSRYEQLFTYEQWSYKQRAQWLEDAWYAWKSQAHNTQQMSYAEKLIWIIEKYDLDDKRAANEC